MDLPKAGILVFALDVDILYAIVKGWGKKPVIDWDTAIFVERHRGLLFILFSCLLIYWAWREKSCVRDTV